MAGDAGGVVGDNAHEVDDIRSWLPGTEVAEALALLAEAEREADAPSRRVSAAKKHVAMAMGD